MVIELPMEKLIREAARAIVTNIVCLKAKFNVLVICGLHNKTLAEHIMLQSYTVGAYPCLWVFDERFFLKYVKFFPKRQSLFFQSTYVLFWKIRM